MKFSDEVIDKILYSNILNKEHKRERSLSFLKVLAKDFKFLFYTRLPRISDATPAILFFSSKTYFDVNALPFPLYTYKERLPKGIELNFSHEEHCLFMAFFMPRFLQRRILSYVYRSIAERLDSINLKVFICNNPEFISYLVAYYFKTKKTILITMQHGTYSKHYQPQFYEKDIADLCFVWGNAYKDCYIRGGVAPGSIKVVSAPFTYSEAFNRKFQEGTSYKPIFLGQQLYKISAEVVDPYNKALRGLIDVYKEKGIRLVYKPHPREDVKRSLLPEIKEELLIIDKKNVTDDFFNPYTHAYSVNSTSLIKALCAGLQCYQINLEVKNIPNEIYAENTSVRWTGIGEIRNHLQKEKFDDNYISEDYINLQPSPRLYNAEILTQIMHESA